MKAINFLLTDTSQQCQSMIFKNRAQCFSSFSHLECKSCTTSCTISCGPHTILKFLFCFLTEDYSPVSWPYFKSLVNDNTARALQSLFNVSRLHQSSPSSFLCESDASSLSLNSNLFSCFKLGVINTILILSWSYIVNYRKLLTILNLRWRFSHFRRSLYSFRKMHPRYHSGYSSEYRIYGLLSEVQIGSIQFHSLHCPVYSSRKPASKISILVDKCDLFSCNSISHSIISMAPLFLRTSLHINPAQQSIPIFQ